MDETGCVFPPRGHFYTSCDYNVYGGGDNKIKKRTMEYYEREHM
jgi:hypothetical protein